MLLDPLQPAEQLAQHYTAAERVEAVALAGSLGDGGYEAKSLGDADVGSDVDLYVYLRDQLP